MCIVMRLGFVMILLETISNGVIFVVPWTILLHFCKAFTKRFNHRALPSMYIGSLIKSRSVLLKRSTKTAFKSELLE